MRRWNGWGDEKTHYPFPESAQVYLAERIGAGKHIPDAEMATVIAQVPAGRLPEHPGVSQNPSTRLLHARGQSLPDWVALRYGRVEAFPDAVAYPEDDRDVQSLLEFARQTGAQVIPYGGGTSVVGHINAPRSAQPVLTIDMSHMNSLLELDETSRLATFGAGVRGPDLEAQLNRHGYTLGHFPQSFELSTLGGWVAARSSGQQSFHYGRIENLFAGGHVETPCGPLELWTLPASAAGPDLRQALLGSEGRLGIFTRATVRVRPLPQFEAFYGVFFPSWEAGVEAVRQIIQAEYSISMARLSNPVETETTLKLSGKDGLVKWAERGLKLAGYGPERCLLVVAVTGDARTAAIARRQAAAIARKHGGLSTGQIIGNLWRKSRFLTPYLRNTLWEHGYAVDTLETAVPWKQVMAASQAIPAALHTGLETFGERAWVFAHLSHVYIDGASIYTTYIFRRTPDPQETLERWAAMKTAASLAVQKYGGTISHQHGVGTDHGPYLPAEKGALGMKLIRSMAKTVDPEGMMNPGKLF